MAAIWRQPYSGSLTAICEDRPIMQGLSGRGVRLELPGHDAVWIVELSVDDCQRIAEEIGWGRPGVVPWGIEE
jgi:hypothetical protein